MAASLSNSSYGRSSLLVFPSLHQVYRAYFIVGMDPKLQRSAVSANLQPPLSNTTSSDVPFPTTTTENSEYGRHVPRKSSSKLTSKSDKLSVLHGAPTHATGMATSPKMSTQRRTNFGLETTRTKRGYRRSLDAFTGTSFPSLSANNLNLESNIPLNLNHAVWDGGLTAGMNGLSFPRTRVGSAPDADGGGTQTPKKKERVSFDSTSDSGSLPTMRSVGQGNGLQPPLKVPIFF